MTLSNGDQLSGRALADGTVEVLVNGMVVGSANAPFFAGTLDEVRVSTVVRYNADFVPAAVPFTPDANTAGLWHFDEGTGQTAADASASANDATLGTNANPTSSDPSWVAGYP